MNPLRDIVRPMGSYDRLVVEGFIQKELFHYITFRLKGTMNFTPHYRQAIDAFSRR